MCCLIAFMLAYHLKFIFDLTSEMILILDENIQQMKFK